MAAQKFVTLDLATAKLKRVAGAQASAGVADAGKLIALNDAGLIDSSMIDPALLSAGADAQTYVAGEAITGPALVYLGDAAGTTKIYKADATVVGKEAIGFIKTSVAADESEEVFFEGIMGGLTGLVAHSRMYLSDTVPGEATATIPADTAGHVLQFVGTAISATELSFEPNDGIIL